MPSPYPLPVELYMRCTQMDGPEDDRVSEKVVLVDASVNFLVLEASAVLKVKFRELQVPETDFTKDSVRLRWINAVLPLQRWLVVLQLESLGGLLLDWAGSHQEFSGGLVKEIDFRVDDRNEEAADVAKPFLKPLVRPQFDVLVRLVACAPQNHCKVHLAEGQWRFRCHNNV